MDKIKFGTDGWRAIIAKEFTVANVARITYATAQWLTSKFKNPTAVIGHDCRFGGALFADVAVKVLVANGVQVKLARGITSTPMVSLACVQYKTDLGIVLTASHNPPEYHGFKLKGGFGGPLFPDDVSDVEKLIPESNPVDLDKYDIDDLIEQQRVEIVDLETLYYDHCVKNFDLEAIAKSDVGFAYDAMYGAGQKIMRRLLPDITLLHCDYNPSFKGQAPEPIYKNLMEFSELIAGDDKLHCGLATDGDADRLGMFNGDGKFIDSHHLILLLIHYLCKYKGMTGKVCTAFSTTVKIRNMCDHYKLDLEVVPIGFKHICEIMVREDVLVGGEESGGIAIKGHIPERDGIWIGLTLWEFIAKSGKSLDELIDEVYQITGSFAFERSDLHIREEQKQAIINKCKSGSYASFGTYKVTRLEDMDGYKYFFNDSDWFMIRPSGTEPVLRTYAEAGTRDEALAILQAGYNTLLS